MIPLLSRFIVLTCILFAAARFADVCAAEIPRRDPSLTVACYYFGNYHPGDPRNERNKGPGWAEWELVKAAKPRFPGHAQPKVPLWGYTDESDPTAMEQKIAAAADHGIDAFIFDWYYIEPDTVNGTHISMPFARCSRKPSPPVRQRTE